MYTNLIYQSRGMYINLIYQSRGMYINLIYQSRGMYINLNRDLPDQEKAAATTLGFTQEMWAGFGGLGGNVMCRPTTKTWGLLEKEEQSAAGLLGFGEVEWDEMRPNTALLGGSKLVRQAAIDRTSGVIGLETDGSTGEQVMSSLDDVPENVSAVSRSSSAVLRNSSAGERVPF